MSQAKITAAGSGIDLLFSTAPDRSNPAVLEGRTVAEEIYVFTDREGVSRVKFSIDGEFYKSEGLVPYDLAGTAGNGQAYPFDTNQLDDGPHTLSAQITQTDGSTKTITANFQVKNETLSSGGEDEIQSNSLDSSSNTATKTPNEGFGAHTQGGLGGKIVRVTTLADNGPGSLRAALEASGPRVVIFEVAGTIWLNEKIAVRNPFLTIAGETAPSPGITVANAALGIHTHDVVVRHLRFRVGDSPEGDTNPLNRDGIRITSPPDVAVYNVLIDHCSVSWAIDKGITSWGPNVHDVTIRYSIISENLSNSTHPKGEHSRGQLIGDDNKRFAVIANLFAHNMARNPYLKGGTSAVIVNNLIYNPGTHAIHISDPYHSGPVRASIVGNVLIPGNNTHLDTPLLHIGDTPTGSEVYLHDNLALNRSTVQVKADSDPLTGNPLDWNIPLSVRPSSDVEKFVLANTGARPADRDTIDLRVIEEVRTHGGWIIDTQNEVEGWENDRSVFRPLSLPNNPHADDDGDGLSNLEEWLQSYQAAVEG